MNNLMLKRKKQLFLDWRKGIGVGGAGEEE
jgi:hypothetical protein